MTTRGYLEIFDEIRGLPADEAMAEIEPGGFTYLGVAFDVPKPVAAVIGMAQRDTDAAREAARFARVTRT